jgi:hypothetical protein
MNYLISHLIQEQGQKKSFDKIKASLKHTLHVPNDSTGLAVPTTSMCRRFGQSHMWLVCTSFLPYPKYDVNRLILYGRYKGPLATGHRLVGLRPATLSEK